MAVGGALTLPLRKQQEGFKMKKIASVAFASAFALALSACGGTEDASDDGMAEDVEMPADEAMSTEGMEEPAMEGEEGAVEEATEAATDAAAAADDAADAAGDAMAAAEAAADAAAAAVE